MELLLISRESLLHPNLCLWVTLSVPRAKCLHQALKTMSWHSYLTANFCVWRSNASKQDSSCFHLHFASRGHSRLSALGKVTRLEIIYHFRMFSFLTLQIRPVPNTNYWKCPVAVFSVNGRKNSQLTGPAHPVLSHPVFVRREMGYKGLV